MLSLVVGMCSCCLTTHATHVCYHDITSLLSKSRSPQHAAVVSGYATEYQAGDPEALARQCVPKWMHTWIDVIHAASVADPGGPLWSRQGGHACDGLLMSHQSQSVVSVAFEDGSRDTRRYVFDGRLPAGCGRPPECDPGPAAAL